MAYIDRGGSSSESYSLKLWNDIIQAHWNYMEADENMEKLLKRQILEVQMRELLYNVDHDRKFFVPATLHVLRETLRRTKDFSACNAMNGFEAVHQYANNLLTKPWRKEFKTIRTYCGYYKQEVERYLVDVELMFLEMGYKKMTNGLLVLTGQLCMDQVANVSRDALLAYVECQIMSDILAQCVQCPVEWKDIFKVREQHIGDEKRAIAMLIGPQHCQYSEPSINYAHVPIPSCNACSVPSQCSIGSNHQPHYSNGYFQNYVDENLPQPPPPPALYYQQQQPQQQHHHHQIPHSRSLDQYDHHRHLTQQHHQHHNSHQPSTSAFHINGRQSLSFDHANIYDTHNRGFNVPGQRFAIPANESNQFQPQFCSSNAYETPNYNTYSQLPHNYHQMPIDGGYPPLPRYDPIPSYEYPQQQLSTQTSTYAQTASRSKTAVTQTNTTYGTPPDPFSPHINDHHDHKLLKTPLQPQRASGRLHFDYEDASPTTNGSETSRGLSDFDSYDEAQANYTNVSRSSSSCNRSPNATINDINGNGNPHHHIKTHSLHEAMAASGNIREQDGVGSFKEWDELYKKTMNKTRKQLDFNDSDNLTMQALDLNHRPDSGRQQTSDKKLARAQEKVATLPTSSAHSGRLSINSSGATSTKSFDRVRPTVLMDDPPRESRRKPKNILEALAKLPAAKAQYEERQRSVNGSSSRKSAATRETMRPELTNGHHRNAINKHSASGEWSCTHCTLLNPMSISICDACSHSKDPLPIGKSSATTTCV